FDGTALLLDPATGKPTAQPLPPKPVPPKPDKFTPNGVPRGKTTTITVTGKDLDQTTRVTSSSPAISVKLGAVTTSKREGEVTVPPNPPAGAVQLVFEGGAGRAPPVTLAVDRYAAIAETGVTDSARAAQPITLPATVAGTIDRAGDVDYFRFEAKAGQQV